MTKLILMGLFFLPASEPAAQTLPGEEELTQEIERFSKVYQLVSNHYLTPPDPDHALLNGAVRGMVATLDPFSALFDPEQFALLQQQVEGKSVGFGTILYLNLGKVLIIQVAEGSPARRAGLSPGDEIVKVNGKRLDQLDSNSLIEFLRAARTRPVRLAIIRPGRVLTEDLDLKPAEIDSPSVDRTFLYDQGIGYLHISIFEQKTASEVKAALEQLDANRLQGLLLDLRGNHGGVLDTALETANLFLREGLTLLTARGRAVPENSYRTKGTVAYPNLPLIVLVDENTASAAEAMVAALQEYDRALIVGKPTFGKGVVQNIFPLSDKMGLALTTSLYFTPTGRSIQHPLPGTMLSDIVPKFTPITGAPPTSHTAGGRPLSGQSGVTPDVTIPPRPLDPWASFLTGSSLFPSFASDYLTRRGRVDESFVPDAGVMEDFRRFLERARIRVPEQEWNQDQEYLKVKIRSEIYNLVFGLTKGEEVEVKGDVQVREAARLLPKAAALLELTKQSSTASTPTTQP